MISINIPGVPVPWARASGGKTRKHFTPQRQRAYMNAVRWSAKETMRGMELFKGALKVSIRAIYTQPKNSRTLWKTSRPDCDNIAKLPLDALNGIVWEDDAIIADLTIMKLYGPLPKMVINIETIA